MSIRMKNPSHPGAFVREMVIEPLGLNVKEASRVLDVARATLSNFLDERVSLSPEMAIRLDKAFGADMATLMRMQTSFDIARARGEEAEIEVAPYVRKGDGARSTAS